MDVTLKMLTERLRQERLDAVEGGHVFAQGPYLLIEHADSPWGVLLQYLCPPAQAIGTLLDAIQRSSVECNLDMCIALAIQHAYLWAVQTTLKNETGLLEARFNLDEVTCHHRLGILQGFSKTSRKAFQGTMGKTTASRRGSS